MSTAHADRGDCRKPARCVCACVRVCSSMCAQNYCLCWSVHLWPRVRTTFSRSWYRLVTNTCMIESCLEWLTSLSKGPFPNILTKGSWNSVVLTLNASAYCNRQIAQRFQRRLLQTCDNSLALKGKTRWYGERMPLLSDGLASQARAGVGLWVTSARLNRDDLQNQPQVPDSGATGKQSVVASTMEHHMCHTEARNEYRKTDWTGDHHVKQNEPDPREKNNILYVLVFYFGKKDMKREWGGFLGGKVGPAGMGEEDKRLQKGRRWLRCIPGVQEWKRHDKNCYF